MKKAKNGFSLVEVVVVITLISTLIAVYMNRLPLKNRSSDKISLMLMEGFGQIEDQYLNYLRDKNKSPTGLTDISFIPAYMRIPMVPSGFNPVYGTNGYLLGLKTGQPTPNNGRYIASFVKVINSNDDKWIAIVNTAAKLPETKLFYNTTAGAVSNMAPPAGSANVYVTYWITRY